MSVMREFEIARRFRFASDGKINRLFGFAASIFARSERAAFSPADGYGDRERKRDAG